MVYIEMPGWSCERITYNDSVTDSSFIETTRMGLLHQRTVQQPLVRFYPVLQVTAAIALSQGSHFAVFWQWPVFYIRFYVQLIPAIALNRYDHAALPVVPVIVLSI